MDFTKIVTGSQSDRVSCLIIAEMYRPKDKPLELHYFDYLCEAKEDAAYVVYCFKATTTSNHQLCISLNAS